MSKTRERDVPKRLRAVVERQSDTVDQVRAKLQVREELPEGEEALSFMRTLREAFLAQLEASTAADSAESSSADASATAPVSVPTTAAGCSNATAGAGGAGAGSGAAASSTSAGAEQADTCDPLAPPSVRAAFIARKLHRLREEIDKEGHNTSEVTGAAVEGKVRELWHTPDWLPPPLLELPHKEEFWSEWTWTGDIDRFELVKSIRRSANRHGQHLSDAELEYGVHSLETVEQLMIREEFDDALLQLLDVLDRIPSFSLAYYKAAMCMLAIHGGPEGLKVAKHPLRCAARLETENRIMRGNIDLVLRVVSGMPVPDVLWTASYPKSAGDIIALAAAVMNSEEFKRRLAAADRATRATKAAEARATVKAEEAAPVAE